MAATKAVAAAAPRSTPVATTAPAPAVAAAATAAAGGGDAGKNKREPKIRVATYKPPRRAAVPLPDSAPAPGSQRITAAGSNPLTDIDYGLGPASGAVAPTSAAGASTTAAGSAASDVSAAAAAARRAASYSRVSLFSMGDDPYDEEAEEKRLAAEEAEREARQAEREAKRAAAQAAASAAAAEAVAEAEAKAKAKAAEPFVDPTTQFRIRTTKPAFYTGIDMLSSEEEERRKKRAAKFHLPVCNPLAAQQSITEDEVSKREQRASKFGFTKDPLEKMETEVEGDSKEALDLSIERRPDAIHMFGSWMANKSTAAVMSTFDDYGPTHVEWISDQRLNVVFGDSTSAARALIGLSRPIPAEFPAVAEQIKTLNLNEKLAAIYVWRLGAASKEKSTMFLRLATVKDTKKSLKERGFSKYYQRIGKKPLPEYRDPLAPPVPDQPVGPKKVSLADVKKARDAAIAAAATGATGTASSSSASSSSSTATAAAATTTAAAGTAAAGGGGAAGDEKAPKPPKNLSISRKKPMTGGSVVAFPLGGGPVRRKRVTTRQPLPYDRDGTVPAESSRDDGDAEVEPEINPLSLPAIDPTEVARLATTAAAATTAPAAAAAVLNKPAAAAAATTPTAAVNAPAAAAVAVAVPAVKK